MHCLQETNDSAAEVFFTLSQLSCRCWRTSSSCTIEAWCSQCSLHLWYRLCRRDSSVSCRCSTPPAEKTEGGRYVTLSTSGGRNNQGLAACNSIIFIIHTRVWYQSSCHNLFKKTIVNDSFKRWSHYCKSYIRIWTASPCSGGHPAAGLSIWAAGRVVTLDVPELRSMLKQIHRRHRDRVQLQSDELLTGVGGKVAGVTTWAAVLLIWAAHSLQTQHAFFYISKPWQSLQLLITASYIFMSK